MRYLTIIFVLLSFNLHSQEFWYEDSNIGVAAGFPNDFAEMWRQPCMWQDIRSKTDVYMIRGISLSNFVNQYGEKFLTDTLAKVLVDNGLSLAIDNPPSNFEHLYNLLTGAGVNITHIAIQSALSRPREFSPRYNPELELRIGEVKSQILQFEKFAPNAQYGIIDARPTKGWDYEYAYRRLKKVLRNGGSNLDFIILDCPYGFPKYGNNLTFQTLKNIESYVKDNLNLNYGFIITDNFGGKHSEQSFHDGVLDYGRDCIANGLNPDYYILMSWYAYPKNALPEKPLRGGYSMTKTGLALFDILD